MKTHTFDHCTAIEEWSGEYPYSSGCWFTVKDYLGKTIKRCYFFTDINPKGETTLDWHLRWAEYYIPLSISLDEAINALARKGKHSEAELRQVVCNGQKAVSFFKKTRPLGLSANSHFNRKLWRCTYEERKFWREMGRNPAHLLLYRLTGFNYLHIDT